MDTKDVIPYTITNRFKPAMQAAFVFGVVVHLGLVVFFYAIDVPEMAVFNVASTLLYILLFYCLLKDILDPVLGLVLGSVEVALHAYSATYFIGYESNFIYFILVLPPIFFLNVKWKFWHAIIYFGSLGSSFFVALEALHYAKPVYVLNAGLLDAIATLVSCLIGVVILGVIFYCNYVLYKNDLKLKQINDVLHEKNEEKKVMLKEIHHRVKNNLQVVNSLLRIQSSEIEDKEIVAMFQKAQSRVLSMALLHENMYRSENLRDLDTEEHIKLLIEELVKSYRVRKDIFTDLKIDAITIGMKTLVPLGLIINEIISNAFKYAFEGREEGVIKVHIHPLSERRYEMIIGDDGVGIEDQEAALGLGTRLIQTFIRQLNGAIERQDELGTVYSITFESID